MSGIIKSRRTPLVTRKPNDMKAKICSVINQKGGVGKSTISVSLAYEIGKNEKVLLIDLDCQSTATDWVANAPEESPFPAAVINLARLGKKSVGEIKKHIDSYDWIIIDCPPSVEQNSSRGALLVSDIVIIPVVPAPSDLWATEAALELVDEAKVLNEDLQVMVMGSRVKNTNLAKGVMDILSDFDSVTFLESYTSDLTAYSEAPGYGVGVTDVPSSGKAKVEFKQIVKEIKNKHLAWQKGINHGD